MRQPRQPRPPREPREPRTLSAFAMPATGTAPRRQVAAWSPFAPRPANEPPSEVISSTSAPTNGASDHAPNGHVQNGHASASNGNGVPTTNGFPTIAFAEPPSIARDPQTHTEDQWASRVRAQTESQWGVRRFDQPQGSQQLCQVWESLLRDEHVPAAACKIWIKATGENGQSYEFYIFGEEVGGHEPGIALFEAIDRRRARPEMPERFVGRIEGVLKNGNIKSCGGGEVSYAPRQAGQAGAWGRSFSPQPTAANPYGAPPPGWNPYAPNPYGMPPAWMMGGAMPGMGMPPHAMYPALAAAANFWQPQQPPKEVAQNPQALAMWEQMNNVTARATDANSNLMKYVFETLREDRGKKTEHDPFQFLERALGLVDRVQDMRGGGAGDEPVTVVKAGGSDILVSNGKVDPWTSAIVNMKSAVENGIARGVAARSGPGAATAVGQAPTRTVTK